MYSSGELGAGALAVTLAVLATLEEAETAALDGVATEGGVESGLQQARTSAATTHAARLLAIGSCDVTPSRYTSSGCS
jgi:hypothetical protein